VFSIFKKKENKKDNYISEVTPKEEYENASSICKYFKLETGVTFDSKMGVLKSRLKSFCKKRKINSFDKLLRDVKVMPDLKQELVDYLTTNETFFYREFSQVKELVSQIKKMNTKVNILCAPSATGEESYSIVIALLEAGVNSRDFSIIGIDINSEAVYKAQIGLYRERNIRNLSFDILEKYFSKIDMQYKINNSVKSHVEFKKMNLFDTSFSSLGKFDFVFSRNMLIYFDGDTKLKAKKILEDRLKDKRHAVFFGHADLF